MLLPVGGARGGHSPVTWSVLVAGTVVAGAASLRAFMCAMHGHRSPGRPVQHLRSHLPGLDRQRSGACMYPGEFLAW
jgi:hypothetical protein